ncbi:MAG TPA: TolC family protein [Kofleriaceae bacterium]|jgi:outer membrane protein TolC
MLTSAFRAALAGAVVVGVAFPGVASADRTLSLEDALNLARTNNRDLAQARTRVSASKADVELARAALMPTVSGDARYTHNYKEVDFDVGALLNPFTQLANIVGANATPAQQTQITAFNNSINAEINGFPAIVITKEEELDASIQANVPLIVPSRWYGLSAAHRAHEAAEATFDSTEASVLVGVAQAYYAAAGTDELVTAREDGVKVATETFNDAKARVAADLANQVDVMRAETAVVRAQQDLAEAANAESAAYRALATLLGTHDTIHVGDQPKTTYEDAAAVDTLVAGAREKRPELSAQRAQIDAANAQVKADAWRWSPNLSAFARANVGNYTGFSGDKYAWAVGVALDWDLYDGGVRDAERHKAEAQRLAAQQRLDLLGDTVADEVANARGTFDTKRKGVNAAFRSVQLARETLRLVRAQYDAGAAKQLDVLQAQDVLVGAEVALAQSHFDVALADLQLRRASGEFPGHGGAQPMASPASPEAPAATPQPAPSQPGNPSAPGAPATPGS